jgi:hypothetical protein
MIDQEQPENVDYVYFNYLSNRLTKDARCICEIKSRIATAKAAFNQNNNFFREQIGLKFKEEISKVLRLECSFCMVLKIEYFG